MLKRLKLIVNGCVDESAVNSESIELSVCLSVCLSVFCYFWFTVCYGLRALLPEVKDSILFYRRLKLAKKDALAMTIWHSDNASSCIIVNMIMVVFVTAADYANSAIVIVILTYLLSLS